MKKVILITISMLAVFSVLLAMSANQLTDRWQTPQQDEINLTVQSPVEMVQKEYKEYNYELAEKLMFEAGEYDTISFAEAVSMGGAVLEKSYPFIDFSQVTFTVNKSNFEMIIMQYSYYDKDLYWSVYCEINSRTGNIENFGYTRNTGNTADAVINEYINKYKDNPEQLLTEEAMYNMEQIGYTDVAYSNNIVREGVYNIFVTGKMNGQEQRAVYKYWCTQDRWNKRYYIEHHFALYPFGEG